MGIRRVYSVGPNVANSVWFAPLLVWIFSIRSAAQSNVEYWTSKARPIGCRIFDIRSPVSRMSNFRHPEASVGCRIFDIRSPVSRMSKTRHPKRVRSNVEYSTSGSVCRLSDFWHSKRVSADIGFLSFDRRRM